MKETKGINQKITVLITAERFEKLENIAKADNKKRAKTASILLSKAIDNYAERE